MKTCYNRTISHIGHYNNKENSRNSISCFNKIVDNIKSNNKNRANKKSTSKR